MNYWILSLFPLFCHLHTQSHLQIPTPTTFHSFGLFTLGTGIDIHTHSTIQIWLSRPFIANDSQQIFVLSSLISRYLLSGWHLVVISGVSKFILYPKLPPTHEHTKTTLKIIYVWLCWSFLLQLPHISCDKTCVLQNSTFKSRSDLFIYSKIYITIFYSLFRIFLYFLAKPLVHFEIKYFFRSFVSVAFVNSAGHPCDFGFYKLSFSHLTWSQLSPRTEES